MFKRLIFIPLLFILAACGGRAIYSENFNEVVKLPELFETESLVAAPDSQNRVLHLIVTEAGINESGWLKIQVPDNRQNYEVEVTVSVIVGEIRLWANVDESLDCSGYALILDPNLDNFRLSTVDPDTCNFVSIDSRSQIALNLNQPYDMTLTVKDGIVSGTIDGVKYFETETTAFPNGIPMIEVLNDRRGAGQVNIDKITIR